MAEQEEFNRELKRLKPQERKATMEFMNSWERTGYDKGKLEGKAELMISLLRQQVGELSASNKKRIQQLSAEQLEALGQALFGLRNKTELMNWLKGKNMTVISH